MKDEELKLKVAAEEIKEILRKHDITASIVLHTPQCGEYVNHLTASYSCAYMYNDEELRFYAKRKDFNSDEEHRKKKEDTANMLNTLAHLSGQNFMMLEPLSKRFDDLTGAEHVKPAE
jgi:hypothetical protein